MRTTHVPIVVRDQERALRFYTDVLGLEKRQDYQRPGSPRWLTVAPKGQEVEMILVEGEPHAPAGPDHRGNHWVFHTDDCRREVERLRERGVAFHEPAPAEVPYGILAAFTDPDGNNITLRQPPSSAR